MCPNIGKALGSVLRTEVGRGSQKQSFANIHHEWLETLFPNLVISARNGLPPLNVESAG